MPIFRRTNCILTASGIVALCKRLHSTPVKSGLSARNRCTLQPFTDSDNTRCYENTICPPEDEHVNARNMSRIVVLTYILLIQPNVNFNTLEIIVLSSYILL